MARQRLLGEAARTRLLGLPVDERDIVRHATLRPEDLTLVAQRRGEANQLGFALILVCLRHPGRVLEADEVPPSALLGYLAQQLDVDAGAFTVYAQRDQTRRTHLAELTHRLGLVGFSRGAFHAVVDWALSIAPSMRDPEAMATALVEELRRRRILLPSLAVLELMVRTVQRRAEAVVHRALTHGLSEQTRAALEQLVDVRPETTASRLAWLRTASRSPAARNMHGLVERLDFVRGLGVPRTLQGAVPQVAFQRLVAEAMRMTAQHLAEATASRRLALLVTVTLHLETALTDAVLSMFDKLMGSLSRRAERRSEEQAARSVGDLRMRLRLLAGGCRALIAARDANADLEEAIELHMGWGRFIRAVNEAEAAAGPEVPDTKTELLSRYSTIRQFAPALLDAFQFRGGRTVAGLLRAIEIVRELNNSGQRTLPAQVPTGFIRRAWRPFVLRNGVVDRRAYEVCALCELRDRLRAGDVWVEGSRDYRDFEDTLLPRPTFDLMKADGPLSLAVDTDGATHLRGWRDLLDERMNDVAALARSGWLPDVDLSDGALKISPLRAITPPEADILQRQAYHALPRVRITDLLLEVDAWTGFSVAGLPMTTRPCLPPYWPTESISASPEWLRPAAT